MNHVCVNYNGQLRDSAKQIVNLYELGASSSSKMGEKIRCREQIISINLNGLILWHSFSRLMPQKVM